MTSLSDSKMVKLITALQLRGFYIREVEGHLTLSRGSHPSDLKALKNLFDNCDIGYKFDDEKFYIFQEDFDEFTLERIVWYPAEHGAGDVGYRSWKYFIKGRNGPKICTLALETGVALFVKSLSAAGITTVLSCDGHGTKAPIVSFYGRYNACWFLVLFNAHLKENKFNYNWELTRTNQSDIDLIALKTNYGWDLELVLEDTLRMASFFGDNSATISQLKHNIFIRNRRSNRTLLKRKNFQETYDWMQLKYQDYVKKHETEIKE
ncbi:hypothetical protein SLL00_04910 [Metabacillus indicus]|uniref:hypothetical protein n=1 Tax=Metabacillus indicus TaxID=246786 RepID=UPI002A040CB3|nr:hypothetical protein [Metabacillus indicus]MDX8289117.1 hypothetical protein [Metabacillus indicus]